ncbi:kinesin-like protein KIF26A [Vombatus ursinus]|uniref:kinesin-like protein KIF26A n=1 Tax=Vombatus ursinus TaxID=29139 RepID=UPI000FFD6FA0|nr:kinesin-like protein KIF26A [Vombatus ursinus]
MLGCAWVPVLRDLGIWSVGTRIVRTPFALPLSHRSLCPASPQVAEGSPCREPLPLELSPRKRLPAAPPDEDRCGNRPPPEGAGAGAGAGSEPSQFERSGRGGWCRHCQTKLAELKRQAWKLVGGQGTPLGDPRISALILDRLQVPEYLQRNRLEGESRCDVCATHLNQLKQEAIQMVQVSSCHERLDHPHGPGALARLASQNLANHCSLGGDLPLASGQVGKQQASLFPGAERKKALAWPPGPGGFPNSSVQVTVAPTGLGGALSSVTIQAQQYLEGMWSISRVNSFLPPACLAEAAMEQGKDGPRGPGAPGQHRCDQPGCCPPGTSQSLVAPGGVSTGTSAAASFFIRAAQKLNLASKKKKPHPPLTPAHDFSIYGTNFSGVLQLSPPPAPPCLLRSVAKAKENPGVGKVKVMVRICTSPGAPHSSEPMSFLKVDSRKKQVTLYDPAASSPANGGSRRTAGAVPKMFAFDAVFPQDAAQAEVCSGTVADVIQSVVNGADGCIFCFGHVRLGKSYTMIGKDHSTQSLGIVPCAISWLFKLINERKEKTGTRFSVRVSAVEISGKDENLKDLLGDVASGSLQDGQSPGVYLREDPICGTQLQNQSELRAPTAEKAAFFLDAALAARSTSRADCDEEDRRNSHMLFTLHIYQYRMEKCGKGGMSGGRSRLHLIDLGSCEKVLSKNREAGGSLCLSLSALGNVILALINGAKHVPYKDSKLTMLLRESLGNINCRTTMIAHISDSPANYAETLTTVQLASRIHRMRKKKSKYASSSSGGESSCEEGRVRRPPHLRPFHPRTVALDPDLPGLGLSSDPDYSSSSEQSCDTVIYVGPNGAALSDRELTDNEGPPEFVPIIPSLNRKRSKDGLGGPWSSDKDHFKCNTFAELQERLECIDGSEEPTRFGGGDTPGVVNGNGPGSAEAGLAKSAKEKPPSPLRVCKKPALLEAASPKKGPGLHFSAGSPRNGACPGNSPSQGQADSPNPVTRGDGKKSDVVSDGAKDIALHASRSCKPDVTRSPDCSTATEPVVKDKAVYGKRPLPSPAPPPPQQKDLTPPNNMYSKLDDSGVRTPPLGMSKQIVSSGEMQPAQGASPPPSTSTLEVHSFHSAFRGKCFDRDILTTTVTLQQPVELNGEDELVFTVVEELSISGMVDSGRPTSIISFNSDCSLQALASGSRPVSIISSINDEFDAYTSQASGVNIDIVLPFTEGAFPSDSRRSSISSWLSEVSLCTMDGDVMPPGEVLTTSSPFACDTPGENFTLGSPGVTVTFTPGNLKNSLNDSGLCVSELDSLESASSRKMSPAIAKNPQSLGSAKAAPTPGVSRLPSQPRRAGRGGNPQVTHKMQTIHSSLPRTLRTTTSTPHYMGAMHHSHELPSPGGLFDDPWLVRVDVPPGIHSTDPPSSPSNPPLGIDPLNVPCRGAAGYRPLKSQTMLACSQRVVDGCEMSCKSAGDHARKPEVMTQIPPLRRGATTLGVMPVARSGDSPAEALARGNPESTLTTSSLKTSMGKKNGPQKSSLLPRPSGAGPPAPPVRKSSLEQKNGISPSRGGTDPARAPASKGEEEAELRPRPGAGSAPDSLKGKASIKGEHSLPKSTSSLKARAAKPEVVHRYGSHMSLERCEGLGLGAAKADGGGSNIGRQGRSVPRLGVPPAAPSPGSPTSYVTPCKGGSAKGVANAKSPAGGSKSRNLLAGGSRSLSSSVKSLSQQPAGKSPGGPPNGKVAPRTMPGVNSKPSRGTIMGTKQAMRAANSRVNELASGSSGKGGHSRSSADSDSGNDSGVNLGDEKLPVPALPSPYSKITAPRRPQRYSSGHGSDNSSVLSGELPPAMGRTALFYHSGGSSGYESMIRDSEATGSASSTHDSMSESGLSSPGGRMRSLKSPKKRSTGLQRRRLVPTPLPEAAALGRKPNAAGQWVDLPPLPGTLKEPFEIKVYEIDDVERLQRHRREEPEPFQDVEKGLMYFNAKLKVLERRHQRIKEMEAKHELLKEELEETKSRLMMDPNKWREEFEVDSELDKESEEYLEALEQATEDLEHCVNVCKAHVMIVTCFDIGVSDVQEVEV